MANICDTVLHFRGEGDKLNAFFAQLSEGSHREIAETFNIALAGDARADVLEIDKNTYTVYQEDAWYPHLALWDSIINQIYADEITYVYKAEEFGCKVFINTDSEGTTFPEEYVLDYVLMDRSDTVYFEDIDSLKAYVKETFGIVDDTIEGIELKMQSKLGADETFVIGMFVSNM